MTVSPYKTRAYALLLAVLLIGIGLLWFIIVASQALSGI